MDFLKLVAFIEKNKVEFYKQLLKQNEQVVKPQLNDQNLK